MTGRGKMPYDIDKLEDLPEYVQDLSAKKRRQWVHVFNSAYASCIADGGSKKECEKSAFSQANEAVKAGRRVRGLRVEQLRKLRKVVDDLSVELDDVLGWAEYSDQQDDIAYGFPLGGTKADEERERCQHLECDERPTAEMLLSDGQHKWFCFSHRKAWEEDHADDIEAMKLIKHGIARKKFSDEHSPRFKAADMVQAWEQVEKNLLEGYTVLGRPKVKGVKFVVGWDGDAVELEAEGEMAAPATWDLAEIAPFSAKGIFTAEPKPRFWLYDTTDKELTFLEHLETLKALQLPEMFTVLAHRPIRSYQDLKAVGEWAVRRPHSTGITIRSVRPRTGKEEQEMDSVATLLQKASDGLSQDVPDIEEIKQAVQDIGTQLGLEPDDSEEAKATRQEQQEARDKRADKYGIGAKEGGALTPPKGYPQAESEYGDPVNFRYPADTERARPALAYFNQEDQRVDGGYTTEEWGIVGKRLAKLISRHLPTTYEYSGTTLQKKEEKGKAASMNEKERRIRDAWYAKFRDPGTGTGAKVEDLWVKDVFDDDIPTHLVVETPNGLFSYPYAFTAEDEIEFGEPAKGELVFRPTGKTASPTAIKVLREDEKGVEIGGHLLLWGNPKQKDLDDEYFTPETQLWLEVYKNAPVLFHHGLDNSIGTAVIGHRIKAVPDDIGVWVEHWLDKSKEFWKMVKPLLEAEALYYSPGSAPHLVEKEEGGRLKSWPVVEDTVTLIPCQFRLLPVEHLKAVYEAANIELPDTLTMQQNDEEERAVTLQIAELEHQLLEIQA